MENLKFRRQFLFTPKKYDTLENWTNDNVGSHYLYTHPDCEVTRVDTTHFELILIGYILDPHRVNFSNEEILNDISDVTSVDEIGVKLYSLVGRFVLLVKKNNEFTFFHDACGLKTLVYTKYNNELYVASQPLLLALVTGIKKSQKYKKYYESKYVKETIEHWIPSGASLFDDVYHLVPNHYLNCETFNQIRYWPNEKLKKEELSIAVKNFSDIFQNSMIAANNRFTLSLPLTAGWDSRIILGGSKGIRSDIWCYTLQYRDLTHEANDIKIPMKLSSRFQLQYKVIDCKKTPTEQFTKIYNHNTDIPHMNDWGEIAYAMHEEYPSNRVAIKGNCSEIGRGRHYYFPQGKHKALASVEQFLNVEPGWEGIEFIEKQVTEWFNAIKDDKLNKGYDLYDLFYWEHRMGSWQAQSQLEWDVVQEVFSPFNNRELLDIMLSVEPRYKKGVKNIFFQKTMSLLWKELLVEPINPLTVRQKIKNVTKEILVNVGVFDTLKALLTKVRD